MRLIVEQKLNESILRRLYGRQTVKRRWDMWVYNLYRYGHEIALALASAGLASPLINLIAGSSDKSQTIADSFRGIPTHLLFVSGLCTIAWLVIKVIVVQEHLMERIPQRLAGSRELGTVEANLGEALAQPDPRVALGIAITESKAIVDRHFAGGDWPYPIGPENCTPEVQGWASDLCDSYQGSWVTPGPMQQRS